jgi:hypothetical protein
VPTAAIAAYGTRLMLSDDVAISGIGVGNASNATPIVLTTGSHGLTIGEPIWVDVAGVGGNTAANGTWIAEPLTTTTMRLRGSVGNGVYTSGGGVTITGTYTQVAEVRDIVPIGMQFRMVDVSAHDGSGWGSSIPTEKVGPNMRVDVNFVPSHATHSATAGFMYLAVNKIRRHWMIIFPDAAKTAFAMQAWVADVGVTTPVSDALRASPTLAIDGRILMPAA